jgi:hypothetical protein
MKEKKKLKIINKWLLIILIFVIIIFGLVYVFKIAKHYPKKIDLKHQENFFGITYSKKYAEEIGLNWKTAYIDILDELQVKQIRIPVYWDQIEKKVGEYNFSDYDFLIKEGEKRDVEIILNFGMRVARWPECHFPDWVDQSNTKKLQSDTLKMLNATVNHFKQYQSITYWQVENEPLLSSFGKCPDGDADFLKKEIELVRKIDSRPIMVSATGELSFWKEEAKVSDVFGTTMYRIVNNPTLGYIKYPYTSEFYRFKAKLAGLKPENVFVIELQAEPWINKETLADSSSVEYKKSFNIDQFKANVQFAINTGFKKTYLWGVEWWYYQYKFMDNPEYWDFAKTLF